MQLLRTIQTYFKEREKVIRQIHDSISFSLYLQKRLEEKIWLQQKTKHI
jgi:hypothetical protein